MPGKPAASVILKALRHVGPELKMPPPPAKKLPEAVIADPVLARAPSSAEVEAALRFVKSGTTGSQLDARQQYAQVLLLTNEVMFVD